MFKYLKTLQQLIIIYEKYYVCEIATKLLQL